MKPPSLALCSSSPHHQLQSPTSQKRGLTASVPHSVHVGVCTSPGTQTPGTVKGARTNQTNSKTSYTNSTKCGVNCGVSKCGVNCGVSKCGVNCGASKCGVNCGARKCGVNIEFEITECEAEFSLTLLVSCDWQDSGVSN